MPSFDVVSKVDIQEVKNGIDNTRREVETRYDFKGIVASIDYQEKENAISLVASDKMRLTALVEMLKQKLAKRNVSLKSINFEEPQPAGGDTLRQRALVKQGLSEEERKRITKLIKESKIKVNSQIQGDQVRVTGKNRDDLQSAIAHLKGAVQDIELQFVNFRD